MKWTTGLVAVTVRIPLFYEGEEVNTHNPHHAYPIGDRFPLLNRWASLGEYAKADITPEELTSLMAGGAELSRAGGNAISVNQVSPHEPGKTSEPGEPLRSRTTPRGYGGRARPRGAGPGVPRPSSRRGRTGRRRGRPGRG